MREIKFRAWVKSPDDGKEPFMENNKFRVLYWLSNANTEPYNPDIIPMQYTGLKDKNGKMIFEGDIVEFTAFEPNHDEYVRAEIKYVVTGGHIAKDSEIAGFVCADINDDSIMYGIGGMGKVEIIGNIYENKELII